MPGLTTHQERELRTLELKKDEWAANAAANAGRVERLVQSLWVDGVGDKAGVLVAAGPSLAESLEEIRGLDRGMHEIVAVDMAWSYLAENGIIPDYVVCADCSLRLADVLDIPRALADEAPARWPRMLLSVTVNPKTGLNWPGEVYWYCLASNVFDRDIGEWMQRDHSAASGVPCFLVPGGNVGSVGLSFLLGVRAAPKVLLYGHDFCWTDDRRFYCGGVRADMAADRIRGEQAAGTVYNEVDRAGRPVKTNQSLVQFATWYRQRMAEYPGVVENRTPATIL